MSWAADGHYRPVVCIFSPGGPKDHVLPEQLIWYKIIVSVETLKNWWTPKILLIRWEIQGKVKFQLIICTLMNAGKMYCQILLSCFNPIHYESWWCIAEQINGKLPQRQTFTGASVKLSWWWQSISGDGKYMWVDFETARRGETKQEPLFY